MTRRTLPALLLLVAVTGCHHATVVTGANPGPQIETPFASSWIYGLVPPSTMETASRCPNGVARVATQLSLPNVLVAMLTIGIYTPMSIEVTCAAASPPATKGDK